MVFKLSSAAVVVGSVVLLGVPAWANPNGEAKIPAAENPVVARVDGAEIRRSDLADAQQSLPPKFRAIPLARMFPALMRQAINTRLVANAARALGLDKADPVKRRLAAAEMRVLASVYLEYSVAKRVTDEFVRQRYEAFAKTARGEVKFRVRRIVLETEDEAIAVIEQLASGGADFATLARAKSKAPDAAKDGDLGFLARGVMVGRFTDAVSALEVGQVTAKPIKMKSGWQVIKVEEKRTPKMPAFEQSRDQLLKLLRKQMADSIVDDLRRAAKIERFDFNGMPAKAAAAASSVSDDDRPASD